MEMLQLPKNDAAYLESITEALKEKPETDLPPLMMLKTQSWFSVR